MRDVAQSAVESSTQGESRSRQIYRRWWSLTELPLGKPVAHWIPEDRRTIGLALFISVIGWPVEEALYFGGWLIFTRPVGVFLNFPVTWFWLLAPGLLVSLLLWDGLMQKSFHNPKPALFARIFCFFLVCIPLISWVFAIAALARPAPMLTGKTGLDFHWDKPGYFVRWIGRAIHRIAANPCLTPMIQILLIAYHLGTWLYLAFHWSRPRADADASLLWAFTITGHIMAAISVWVFFQRTNRANLRWKRVLIGLTLIPVHYLASLLTLILLVRWKMQPQATLLGSTLEKGRESALFFLRARAKRDWGHSTGRTLLHPRTLDNQETESSHASKMVGALFRLRLVLSVPETSGLVLITLSLLQPWPNVAQFLLDSMLILILVGVAIGFFGALWFGFHNWRRSKKENVLIAGFSLSSMTFYSCFLSTIALVGVAALHDGKYVEAGLFILCGSILFLLSNLFFMFLRAMLVAKLRASDFAIFLGYLVLFPATCGYCAFFCRDIGVPQPLMTSLMALAMCTPLVNWLVLRGPFRWYQRRCAIEHRRITKLFSAMVFMPMGALLFPFLAFDHWRSFSTKPSHASVKS